MGGEAVALLLAAVEDEVEEEEGVVGEVVGEV